MSKKTMKINPTVELSVTFSRELPSGKAFVVEHEGAEYVIPNFAVDDDSEIWPGGCEGGETGKLVMRESIAFEKGLVDPGSQWLGGGIPMKRNRLPDLPMLVSNNRDEMDAIGAWVDAATDSLDLEVDPEDPCTVIDPTTKAVMAVFDGPNAKADAELFADAKFELEILLGEVDALRDWMGQAIKRFNDRRKRS